MKTQELLQVWSRFSLQQTNNGDKSENNIQIGGILHGNSDILLPLSLSLSVSLSLSQVKQTETEWLKTSHLLSTLI